VSRRKLQWRKKLGYHHDYRGAKSRPPFVSQCGGSREALELTRPTTIVKSDGKRGKGRDEVGSGKASYAIGTRPMIKGVSL